MITWPRFPLPPPLPPPVRPVPLRHHPPPFRPLLRRVDVAAGVDASVAVDDGVPSTAAIKTACGVNWICWRKMPVSRPETDAFATSRTPTPSPRCTKTTANPPRCFAPPAVSAIHKRRPSNFFFSNHGTRQRATTADHPSQTATTAGTTRGEEHCAAFPDGHGLQVDGAPNRRRDDQKSHQNVDPRNPQARGTRRHHGRAAKSQTDHPSRETTRAGSIKITTTRECTTQWQKQRGNVVVAADDRNAEALHRWWPWPCPPCWRPAKRPPWERWGPPLAMG